MVIHLWNNLWVVLYSDSSPKLHQQFLIKPWMSTLSPPWSAMGRSLWSPWSRAVSVSLPSSSALHRANTISQTCICSIGESLEIRYPKFPMATRRAFSTFMAFKDISNLVTRERALNSMWNVMFCLFSRCVNANKKQSKHISYINSNWRWYSYPKIIPTQDCALWTEHH